MYDDSLVVASAAQYGVDPNDIRALIQTESSGDPNAYRAEPQIGDASYGLMQLLYSTVRGMGYSGVPSGLYDPATNIDYGTNLWSQDLALAGGDKSAAYSMYNSGSLTAYQSNSSVAAHVQSFLANLANTAIDNPESSAGIGGLVLVALIYWFLRRKK